MICIAGLNITISWNLGIGKQFAGTVSLLLRKLKIKFWNNDYWKADRSLF
jgi:hypothetical protein